MTKTPALFLAREPRNEFLSFQFNGAVTMRRFKWNLYIGMTLSVFMMMTLSDGQASPENVPPPEPTVISLQAQIDSARAAQFMNVLTGLCIKTAMGKGLDPDSVCIMEEPDSGAWKPDRP